MRLFLSVSGFGYGYQDVAIRTTDPDIDLERRVTPSDQPVYCDYDWDGTREPSDSLLLIAHKDHWRRNALHGTMVKRTNLQSTYGIGAGRISWSPNGSWIVLSANTAGYHCAVFVVPSNPSDGNVLRRVTFSDSADYDPNWSPLGDQITFGRKDLIVYRKGVPGFATDTLNRRVTYHNNGAFAPRGDFMGSVSPDGQWVVFSRRTLDPGPFELFKIPIWGDSSYTVKLTSHASVGASDHYPMWSPDGQWIVFQRQTNSSAAWDLYKIRADGSDSFNATLVHDPGSVGGQVLSAANPAFAPDGMALTCVQGKHGVFGTFYSHVLDPGMVIPIAVANYVAPEFEDNYGSTYPILMPTLSPDGTRLALSSSELWAVRRNMNNPPRFTNVVGAVHDTTAIKTVLVGYGQRLSFTLEATDIDDAARTYHAAYLVPGMSFWSDGVFLWDYADWVGTHYIKFWVTNGSSTGGSQNGGMDAIILKVIVTPPLGPGPANASAASTERKAGLLAVDIPKDAGVQGVLRIFDVMGRLQHTAEVVPGETAVWNGENETGGRVVPGVYFYRIEVGQFRQRGRVAVMR